MSATKFKKEKLLIQIAIPLFHTGQPYLYKFSCMIKNAFGNIFEVYIECPMYILNIN